jgi:hypothetical protein
MRVALECACQICPEGSEPDGISNDRSIVAAKVMGINDSPSSLVGNIINDSSIVCKVCWRERLGQTCWCHTFHSKWESEDVVALCHQCLS